MTSHSPNLLIVGASARAAAHSALRAGFSPWTADLFGDQDLRAVCDGVVIVRERYPHTIPELLERWDASIPCMYTGALENHPEVLERIALQRPLWGNSADVVRKIRDPFQVHEVLTKAGLAVPEVRRSAKGNLTDGRWLRKPFAGAGGRGIEHGHGSGSDGRHYFQRFQEGDSVAAVFDAKGGDSHLLGVTRQLVGEPWLNARPFHYCGSVGPLRLDDAVVMRIQRIGQTLTEAFGLRGLFGVDAILSDGEIWPVEINPRYTASVEVLELGKLMMGLAFVGKAILFARRDIPAFESRTFSALSANSSASSAVNSSFPSLADIPTPGSRIEAGWPILTLISHGDTIESCLDSLRREAASLDRRLHGE